MPHRTPHHLDPYAWLTSPAGAKRARPEEEGAWKVVDALGLLRGPDGASGLPVGRLQVWRGAGVLGLDYGLDGEDPTAGIGFVVTREALEVRLPLVGWEEGRPVVSTFLWRRVDWKALDRAALAALAREALAAGRSAKRPCSACGKPVALGRYQLAQGRILCFPCAPAEVAEDET